MRDFLTKDIFWKVLSLVLAITIYFTVQEVRRAPREFGPWENRTFGNVPVIINAEARDVRAFKIEPEFVSVTIRATPDVMSGVSTNDIQANVDLRNIEPTWQLRRRVSVSVPSGVTWVRTVPNAVTVIVPPKSAEEK